MQGRIAVIVDAQGPRSPDLSNLHKFGIQTHKKIQPKHLWVAIAMNGFGGASDASAVKQSATSQGTSIAPEDHHDNSIASEGSRALQCKFRTFALKRIPACSRGSTLCEANALR